MTQPSTTVVSLAPAKVNLTLRILGRRSDGYHLIESLMVPVSLWDRVELTIRPGTGSVTCSVAGAPDVPGGAGNLAAAAARRLLDELRERTVDVDLHLGKRIPCGAGLGGGSSDAAAVLRMLPAALGRALRPRRIAEIALGLGADVPFFLTCRPSVAMGVGEILVSVPRFPDLHLVVAVPPAQVSTTWAYEHAVPDAAARGGALTSEASTTTRSLRLRLKREPMGALLSNDFEARVEAAFPDVGRLKRKLKDLGADATVMSGSGSAVVGLFRTGRTAAEAATVFEAPDRAYAVRVLRRRPAVADDGR